MKKYFTFEVQVLDDKNVRRRFRASNYQSTTRVKPFICTMPMRLDEGWNQIQFNLSDFTRRAYGTNYIETLRYFTILIIDDNLEFKSMLTAESEESISQTDSIPKTSFPQNSNSSSQSLERHNKCERIIISCI